MLSLTIWTLAALWCGFRLSPVVLRFLRDHRMTALNYRGDRIPVGSGLLLWVLLFGYSLVLYIGGPFGLSAPAARSFAAGKDLYPLLYPYLFTATLIFGVGWMDDTIGSAERKGLRGHLRAWREERVLTTGMVKAGMTVLAALWIVHAIGNPLWLALPQVVLIALMTNFVNLLDLRPGRAIKGTMLLWAGLAVSGAGMASLSYLFPLLIGLCVLLPADAKARAMLGDAGANMLGFCSGFCTVNFAPLWYQAVLGASLLCLQLVAEHRSLGALIEQNRCLHWLDRLGRS